MAKRKPKKPRGSRGVRQAPCLQDRVSHPYLDLHVPLPKPSPAAEVQIQSKLLLTQVMNRLANTGYSTVAVTHVVYGSPKPKVDDPDSVFPDSLLSSDKETMKRPGKRRRKEADLHDKKPPIRVLKRLHAVVENLSDISAYALRVPSDPEPSSSKSDPGDLLASYDVVSVSPRNDATFQAACASATAADIITLDYTSGRGGVQLPFRIRPADLKAAAERGAVLELPYAPALLRLNLRKALVQTARELQLTCTSVMPKPRILFSSGDRIVGDTDVGAMALRSPGDLINLLQTVLRFDQTTSYNALSASATAVLTKSHERRFREKAGDVVVEVCIQEENGNESAPKPPEGDMTVDASITSTNVIKPLENDDESASEGVEDGFITLT